MTQAHAIAHWLEALLPPEFRRPRRIELVNVERIQQLAPAVEDEPRDASPAPESKPKQKNQSMHEASVMQRQNLFVFRFRLLPAHLCRNLYFWDVGVGDAQFLCTRDLLSVSFAASSGDAIPLLTRAKTLATALVDAHAYLSFPFLASRRLTSYRRDGSK